MASILFDYRSYYLACLLCATFISRFLIDMTSATNIHLSVLLPCLLIGLVLVVLLLHRYIMSLSDLLPNNSSTNNNHSNNSSGSMNDDIELLNTKMNTTSTSTGCDSDVTKQICSVDSAIDSDSTINPMLS